MEKDERASAPSFRLSCSYFRRNGMDSPTGNLDASLAAQRRLFVGPYQTESWHEKCPRPCPWSGRPPRMMVRQLTNNCAELCKGQEKTKTAREQQQKLAKFGGPRLSLMTARQNFEAAWTSRPYSTKEVVHQCKHIARSDFSGSKTTCRGLSSSGPLGCFLVKRNSTTWGVTAVSTFEENLVKLCCPTACTEQSREVAAHWWLGRAWSRPVKLVPSTESMASQTSTCTSKWWKPSCCRMLTTIYHIALINVKIYL